MIAEHKSASCSPSPLRVLVITHVETEGPGVFGELLRAAGADVRLAQLHLGDTLPAAGGLDAALSMGGPMNVYEEQRYPFLREETRFLQAAAARDLPVLGICLGAQMIAKAAGAAVKKHHINQAFRFRRSYGLQFHLEADRLARGPFTNFLEIAQTQR